jgi:hypothetical protein
MEQEKKKRAKPVTTTDRSRKFLEKQGYIVALVERSVNAPRFFKGNPTGEVFRNKFDAFGFADLICVRADVIGTLYIQSTTVDHQAERRQKVLDAKATRTILLAGNQIVVHGWGKKGPRGQKTWQVTESRCVLVSNDANERDPEPSLVFTSESGRPLPVAAPLFEETRERRIVRRVASETHGL